MCALCASQSLYAQDFERYLPQPYQAPTYRPEIPEQGEVKVGGSDAVLVDRLDAILVLDDAEKVDANNAHDNLQGVSFDFAGGDSLVYSAEFRRICDSYLGEPITLRRLNELSRDIILYYRKQGQPIVDVVIPEQRITAGTVQIVVIESRVGKITLRGGCYFDSCMLADQVCSTRSGQRVYEKALERDLVWLNRNPFRRVELDLKPGEEEGTTDVHFVVDDWRPVQAYIGYEDTGVQSLMRERLLAGFIWGNAFGRDAIMSYQYTADGDLSHLHAHAVSYYRDWNRCWSFQSFASWAGTSPASDPLFDQAGESWQAAVRMKRHLCRTQWKVTALEFGMDFKTSNTNLEFGGHQVFDSAADVWQFMVGYEHLRRFRDQSYFLLDYDFYFSPGQGFSSGHTEEAYNTIRANTEPGYVYHRGRGERLWNLPNCWQLVARGTAQAASDRLLYSEMLGLGGYDTVRGYDQRTLNADAGLIGSLELGPRPYQFCGLGGKSQLRTYGFLDGGTAYIIDPLPTELDDTSLGSIGIGMRLAVSDHLTMRVDIAEPLRDVPGIDTQRTLHLGMIYRFGGGPR